MDKIRIGDMVSFIDRVCSYDSINSAPVDVGIVLRYDNTSKKYIILRAGCDGSKICTYHYYQIKLL